MCVRGQNGRKTSAFRSGVARGGGMGAAPPLAENPELLCTLLLYNLTVHGTPTRNCNWITQSKQRLLFCTSFYLVFAKEACWWPETEFRRADVSVSIFWLS